MVNLRSKKGAGNVSVAHVTTMTSIKCDGLRMFRTDSVSNALERRNVKMNSKLEFSNIEIDLNKLIITKEHLLPEILTKMGLTNTIKISDEVIKFIIIDYTCEPGDR